MMLVSLLNVPRNDQEWQSWSFSHRNSHTKIRQAILQQKGINLTDYQLDPINFDAINFFLQNNQQMHQDMSAALGSQGSDLEEVDFDDEQQKASWIYYHYLEHQTAEEALKI